MENQKIVIITGLSGSGKSTVMKAMEDIGFFCIDNLPVTLLPKLLELKFPNSEKMDKLAIVMDIREGEFLKEYPGIFSLLVNKGYNIEVVFLEAEEEILVRRFSETRRVHPLSKDGSMADGIVLERELLADLKKVSSKVIDTSYYNIHQLKSVIMEYFSQVEFSKRIPITLISFGFKYGVPYDADILMDVRFLPNPYFDETLRPLSGEKPSVARFVLEREETAEFIGKFTNLLLFLLPLYEKEGKAYLTIAIGCTGGRHRSVAIVNSLKQTLQEMDYKITVRHRDLESEGNTYK
ncbi:MAG: RNase adapter RapZ [Thermodesulfobacteriota bacterium]|nr:RNase adapter RapZ [Thermodesulfobacteriota bacterium]